MGKGIKHILGVPGTRQREEQGLDSLLQEPLLRILYELENVLRHLQPLRILVRVPANLQASQRLPSLRSSGTLREHGLHLCQDGTLHSEDGLILKARIEFRRAERR